jgi:predicted ATPase
LDNQDVPLEDWPVKLIAALARAGFAVVPVELPHDALGRAAIAGDAVLPIQYGPG